MKTNLSALNARKKWQELILHPPFNSRGAVGLEKISKKLKKERGASCMQNLA
jgi:hypothetical protein